jgi:MoxR-like ATPase
VEKLNEERTTNNKCWEAHKHLNAAVARVEDGLVERGEDSRLVVLAMIANEHILLLGKPGTGKYDIFIVTPTICIRCFSAISRTMIQLTSISHLYLHYVLTGKSVLGLRLAKLCNGTFFQRLLTRFTTPEELFGPLSLKSLQNDEYRRVTSGFLPTADIAFLDEIFKANSAILNTLLTILNERKFDNGGSRELCPMRCVVGASNELPDSDELVALYDRFLIRKEVVPVTDEGVMELLSMSNPGESSCEINSDGDCEIPLVDDLDGIIKSLSSASDSILMDVDACELMRDMRAFLRENHDIEISDRRLVKAARLLKISAASDGRGKVDTLDFLLLQHCFWNEPSERVAIREWLWDNLTPSDRGTDVTSNQIRFLLDNLRKEILSVLRKTNGCIESTVGAKPGDIAALNDLREESERIAMIASQKVDALARHMELVRRSEDFTWIEPDDASAIQQFLLPRAELLWPQMKKVAEDAKALGMAISSENSLALSNELRGDVIELLWEDGSTSVRDFTEEELQISIREAKSKYDLETFRRWKRAKKKSDKASN